MGDIKSMKDVKIFISGDILYIYKVKSNGDIHVVAVEEDTSYEYSIRTISLKNKDSLVGEELEEYIIYAISDKQSKLKAQELSKDEVYSEVDDIIDEMSKEDTVRVLNTFVLPEKKQTPVESILADILKLSYKERSDVLIALLDMM